MRAFLLFVIMLIAIPVSFLNTYHGILVYYWVNFMRPLELAWYIAYFEYGTYLAAAVLSGYFLFTARKEPIRLTYLGPIIVLWLLITLSATTSYIPVLAWRKWWEFTKVLIICILTVTIIRGHESRLKTLMLVIALSAGVLGLHGLKQAVFTGGGMVKGPGGQLAENNDFAIYLNMMIPIIYYVGKYEENKRWRRLCAVMAISAGIAAVFTYSRAGFLELCAVVLIISSKASRKWVGMLGLGFAVVVFLAFAPQSVKDRIASIKTAREQDASTQSRFDAWRCAMKMVKHRPLYGVGPMNFSHVFNLYQSGIPWDTHNGFLRITAESGIPALVVFVYIILHSLAVLRSLRRRLRKAGGPPQLILYCNGMVGMMAAYVIGNLFNSRHDLENYYYLISVIACIRIQGEAWLSANTMTDRERRIMLFKQRFGTSPVPARAGAPVS